MEKTKWLVEYREAVPCPIYATDGPFYTCNPHEAIGFDSKEEAERWMHRPEIIGFSEPWFALSHGFTFDKL